MENDHLLKIAVVGAGAFGTAVAEIAARNGNKVTMVARKQEVVDSINQRHVNPHYLSEFTLSENVTACLSVHEALEGCELLFLAIPTQLVLPATPSECRPPLYSPTLSVRCHRGWVTTKKCFLPNC